MYSKATLLAYQAALIGLAIRCHVNASLLGAQTLQRDFPAKICQQSLVKFCTAFFCKLAFHFYVTIPFLREYF